MRRTLLTLAILALTGCGDSSEPECPTVTPENVHLMTGDTPPGSPCTQVLRENAPRVQDEVRELSVQDESQPLEYEH